MTDGWMEYDMDNGGPASEKTLLDEFAGQALSSLDADTRREILGMIQERHLPSYDDEVQQCRQEVSRQCYLMGEDMIAEKRRRETIDTYRRFKRWLGPTIAKMPGSTAHLMDAEIERLEKGEGRC